MRPVTDSFLAAVRGSHKMVARATIVEPWQVGVEPIGTEIPILDGDVVMDINADITSTLDLTTRYPWPNNPGELGTPYGQEIYVQRGIQYGNGTVELVGLGYFRINDPEQDHVPDGPIRLTGTDRMSTIIDGRRTEPIQFGAGASVKAVVDFLVHEVLPGIPVLYDWAAGSELLGVSHVLERDRHPFIKELLMSYGKIMYFDYAGRLQVKSAPDPTTPPVYTVNHGRNGVLVSMKRALSRAGVHNGFIVTGEAAGELPPVSGSAFDLTPTSPTYWLGPFGQVPEFFSSSFMETDDQCDTAAAAMLTKEAGLPYAVSVETVPMTALEGGDVVAVDYANNDAAETHIADKLSYPLTPSGVMDIDTRKQFL